MVMVRSTAWRALPGRSVAARLGTALALGLAVAGCSAGSYVADRATTVQGKHTWKTCEQLKNEYAAHTKQIEDLSKLVEKAERESAGVIIGAAVYGPPLAQARGERRVVGEAMAANRCPQS